MSHTEQDDMIAVNQKIRVKAKMILFSFQEFYKRKNCFFRNIQAESVYCIQF
jgi:hypothetical protein